MVLGFKRRAGLEEIWVHKLTLALAQYFSMALGTSLNLSVPQLPTVTGANAAAFLCLIRW